MAAALIFLALVALAQYSMLREFKTSTILDLDEGQVFRLVKYMAACVESRPKSRAARRKSSNKPGVSP